MKFSISDFIGIILKKKFFRYGVILAVLAIILLGSFYLLSTPRNNLDWDIPQKINASAEFNDSGTVVVRNIRNFRYRTPADYDIDYYDKTFDLDELVRVDFIIDPFTKFRGIAHTMIAFGFADGTYVDVSIEARRERGESYHTYQGLFNKYEFIYIVADERDVLALRTNTRDDKVYLYEVDIDKETAQKLFISVMERVNKLNEKPEFYNTFTNNCTTSLVRDINKVLPKEKQIGFTLKYVFPGYSDRLAYDLGFLDDSVTFEKLRENAYISDKARQLKVDESFSRLIRE